MDVFALIHNPASHCVGLLKDAEAGLCGCACITGVQPQSNTGLISAKAAAVCLS